MNFSFGFAKYIVGIAAIAILWTVIPGIIGKIVIIAVLALVGYFLYIRKGSDG